MISARSRLQEADERPDLTPLLDLIFIVMVFLLLTTNIRIQSLPIDVPTTEDKQVLQTPDSTVIAVNILATAPNWALEQKRYTDWTSFSKALLTQYRSVPGQTIVIGADKQAEVQYVLKLLAFLQANHVQATSIIMEDQQP